MNLHEFQAKQLFASYGVPIPRGGAAESVDQARAIVSHLGDQRWVVKAQIHAGGRGKAGGVQIVEGVPELERTVTAMLGSRLVTHQTGPSGLPVSYVLIEPALEVQRELYLGAVIDRARERVVFMASAVGGMDIEQVAATQPEKILTLAVDPVVGLQPYEWRQVGFALQLEMDQFPTLSKVMSGLYRMFTEEDASLVEINPLVITAEGELMAADAKINLDDNALFRHDDLLKLKDPSQENDKELLAQQHGLNYIPLEGSIACMVNGAGLAMATMDIIKLHGGEPANFLDVGGGTTAERVAEAFKLILSDDKVKAVLVNIFGGIVRCDLIAEGIIKAVEEVHVAVPVVVRLEGTNVEQGKAMLRDSGLDIVTAEGLTDAAQKVVKLAVGGSH
ncbi:MAG: ADP-forming succinate--CoA ligase subunit beta [Gammaproteobacteria bacterium]